jgi:hypothetical protein
MEWGKHMTFAKKVAIISANANIYFSLIDCRHGEWWLLAERAPGFERLDNVEQTLDEVERTVLGVTGKQQQKRREIGEETDQQRIGRHQLAIALCGGCMCVRRQKGR